MSRMVFVSEDALCFPSAALSVDGVHRGEVRVDDPLCSVDDPLQRFPLGQGGVAVPHCDSAGEDAFSESSVGLMSGCRLSPAFFSTLMKCSLC